MCDMSLQALVRFAGGMQSSNSQRLTQEAGREVRADHEAQGDTCTSSQDHNTDNYIPPDFQRPHALYEAAKKEKEREFHGEYRCPQ